MRFTGALFNPFVGELLCLQPGGGLCLRQASVCIRKFPESSEQSGGRPLPERDQIFEVKQKYGFFRLLRGSFLFCTGKRSCVPFLAAPHKERSGQLSQCGKPVWGAKDRSQLHQALRKRAAASRGINFRELCGNLLSYGSLCNAPAIFPQTRNNAQYISVYRRFRLFKRNRRDRARRVRPDAGQRKDLLIRIGENTVVFAADDLSRFLQVSCARVIAKAFP